MRSFLGVPIVARGEVIGALYLTEKEGEPDVLGRRPEADRAARRARRDRDRERAPARAQPRAEHHRGAQPARARAARLRHAAAVRRRAGGRVGVDAAGARPRRRGGGARAGAQTSRAARWRSCARWSSSCGPASLEAEGLATVLRKHVEVLRRVSGPARSSCACATCRGSPPARRPRCCGSRRRRSATRSATPARSTSACKLENGDERLVLSVADDGCGFDPEGPEVRGQRLGLTSMQERATELGGTLTRRLEARRRDHGAAGGAARDPRPARRRPRGRAPGPAHVPRPAGRHRGRGRGRRRRGRGRRRRRAPTRT